MSIHNLSATVRAYLARLFTASASTVPVMFSIEESTEDGDLHVFRNHVLLGVTSGSTFMSEFRVAATSTSTRTSRT